MKTRLYSKIKRIRKTLASNILRQRVRAHDFTIVSVDCWGSSIYQEMNLPYNTPFVGLFFYAPCYIKLLSNLRDYLDTDLSFTTCSKYPVSNQERLEKSIQYPIGILGSDVEVHFLHYKDENEARFKWNARRERMNFHNLFVEFSDRNLCGDTHLKEFDQLDFPHKVVFTAQPHPEIKSSVWLSECAGQPYIDNIYTKNHIYKRYFDVASWLNGGSGEKTFSYDLVNRFLEIQ